jgi:hypothetical protein
MIRIFGGFANFYFRLVAFQDLTLGYMNNLVFSAQLKRDDISSDFIDDTLVTFVESRMNFN